MRAPKKNEKNISPQPCKYCNSLLEFYQLGQHLSTCSRRPIQCGNCKEIFPLDLYTLHKENCQKTTNYITNDLIPCEICNENISFSEYNFHLKAHKNNNNYLKNNNKNNKKDTNFEKSFEINDKILCEYCNKDIFYKEYSEHYNFHKLQENSNNYNYHSQEFINFNSAVKRLNIKYGDLLEKADENSKFSVFLFMGNRENEGTCCAICLCDYKEKEWVKSFPCLHKFHRDCADKWLFKNKNCPMCKYKI